MKGGPLQFLGSGALGYFCSVAGRTIPRYALSRGVPNVEVVNLGASAQQIGPDGKAVGRDIQRGEIIYRGPCKIACAGNVRPPNCLCNGDGGSVTIQFTAKRTKKNARRGPPRSRRRR